MPPRRAPLLARAASLPLAWLAPGRRRVRPGWSSSDGGSEELPEFRDAARSSRSIRADSSAFAASSSPTRAASAAL
ncbi:MAG TPA: hypothetical protein VGD83_35435, partial [Streptosporangiaceae bacterium]